MTLHVCNRCKIAGVPGKTLYTGDLRRNSVLCRKRKHDILFLRRTGKRFGKVPVRNLVQRDADSAG